MTHTEGGRNIQFEAAEAMVSMWMDGVYTTGEVGTISREMVAFVLEGYGAEFKPEARDSLSQYTNLYKREGLDLIWGKERIDAYRKWIKSYVEEYESVEGNAPLPALKKSGIKTSGMMHFLGELTAYAAGALKHEEFAKYTKVRVLNGRLWQEGRKGERQRVDVPDGKGGRKAILPASIPPDFAPKALDWLKSTTPPKAS